MQHDVHAPDCSFQTCPDSIRERCTGKRLCESGGEVGAADLHLLPATHAKDTEACLKFTGAHSSAPQLLQNPFNQEQFSGLETAGQAAHCNYSTSLHDPHLGSREEKANSFLFFFLFSFSTMVLWCYVLTAVKFKISQAILSVRGPQAAPAFCLKAKPRFAHHSPPCILQVSWWGWFARRVFSQELRSLCSSELMALWRCIFCTCAFNSGRNCKLKRPR